MATHWLREALSKSSTYGEREGCDTAKTFAGERSTSEHYLKVAPAGISFRTAASADVADMAACRLTDPSAGSADPRMAACFQGRHHPQRALMPRIGYVAVADKTIVGYIAGHLTTRHECAGEVQYLFVTPTYRRQGIATALLRLMAGWFQKHAAARVCVCVDADSPAAQPFYQTLGASPLSPVRRYWYIWEDIGVLVVPAQG